MSAAAMTQLNARVDAHDKERAAEVLSLMGLTVTDLVRAVLAKVARGARDCSEVMSVLDGSAATVREESEEPAASAVLLEGWALGERYMQSLGYESMACVPQDDRPWDDVYEEAMEDKALEKGWLS